MLTLLQRIAISGLVSLFSYNVLADGGEIGNGVPFVSQLGEYSVQVPRNWNLLSLDRSVSLTLDKAQVAIADRDMSEVTSTNNLLATIKHLHPEDNWAPVKIANKNGFVSQAKNGGKIYLYRETGRVLSVRMNELTTEIEKENVEIMLQTLRVK